MTTIKNQPATGDPAEMNRKSEHSVCNRICTTLTAALVVVTLAFAAKVLFFKAKTHSEETKHLAETAVMLGQQVESLEQRASIVETRKDMLLGFLNFQIDNPDTVLMVANLDGLITEVDGDVAKWGYTRKQLIGMKMENLRPASDRIAYRINYMARAREGETGGVYFFRDRKLLGGDGNEYATNGGVFWHEGRREFVAFIAPVVVEEP
jgi:hypothetical protein